MELLAELGIALLLFVVGLKLDPHEIKSVGPVAIIAGMGQIIMTGILGYFLANLLGFSLVPAFYIGLSLTFSSTIIVVKLLSDRQEIDALHGRIALGVLIVQDLVVVVAMILLTAFSEDSQQSLSQEIVSVVLKGGIFLLFIAFLTRYILPKLLHALAYSTELLLIFAISWAITLAAMGDSLGFSKEVGAFVAGVSLASTSYRATIGARLVSLRDFLLLFFFIDLGIHVNVSYLGAEIISAVVLSLFVLVGKTVMIMALMSIMGYGKHTSTVTSLSLSQISEFSLIIAALGLDLGHIDENVLGLITLVVLITMGVSTYMIMDSHIIYEKLLPIVSHFDKLIPHRHQKLGNLDEVDVYGVDIILFGLGRYGGSLIRALQGSDLQVLGVDFNPELVRQWRNKGLLAFYGDAEDPEFAATLPLNQAKWVISTLPGERIGLTLLHTLEYQKYQGKIALTSHTEREMEILKNAGSDLVLLPFRDAAYEAARVLVTDFNE
ncbi:cation:proton antiporter [Crocosphaera watsonii]|uniref:Kef-type K+ transport system predicted NAD-binding component-like protein n=2 Tax=Crocosphaera watsonii TaxID=263511 RepID=G5J6A8_CROWT|nr:cation:proton antiporter family protein [Crocosphaera watsonii]EHJ12257.1 Kef-type K+ transport system predicted NAD-binding component-like protein [Crocosphaera watsonii WH 0003]CCQ54203.1 putative Glutathione-regulated potassium-efflux system protein KefB [Crocosphaera watsonii WH 0005]